MKTIILFRHGKSDWHADFDHDHERPVNKRGIKASRAMGKWLSDTDQVPSHTVISSALRTQQTFKFAAEEGEWDTEMVVDGSLYDSTVEAYLHVLKGLPDSHESALIVGHEPTCSGTTSRLAGRFDVFFPTATMARLDLDIESWSDVAPGCGTLIWLKPPKFL